MEYFLEDLLVSAKKPCTRMKVEMLLLYKSGTNERQNQIIIYHAAIISEVVIHCTIHL